MKTLSGLGAGASSVPGWVGGWIPGWRPSTRPGAGPAAMLALQGQAGNRAVSALIRQVQRLQDTDTSAAAAGSRAMGITPEAVDGVASQLASDDDTALGVRIPIEPGLLALASGAGVDGASG